MKGKPGLGPEQVACIAGTSGPFVAVSVLVRSCASTLVAFLGYVAVRFVNKDSGFPHGHF